MLPSALTEIWSCFSVSGVFSGSSVTGMLTGTPFCSMGVTTMKMMRSTRQTSTSGVTLMSEVSAVFCSFPTELCHRCLIMRARFLHEVDRHLRAGVGHLDGEAIDAVLEVVIGPHRRNGHEQTERGGDERLGDTGRHRGDAAAGGGHLGEGVDDADNGAEQPDERRRCANGGR